MMEVRSSKAVGGVSGEGGGGVLTVVPHTPFTLDAVGFSQRTHAGVSAQAFPAVAHPSFAEVAHCPLAATKGYWRHKNKSAVHGIHLTI